jgi:hypothetical protein
MSEEKTYRSDGTRGVAAALVFMCVLIFAAGAGGISGGIHRSAAVSIVGVGVMIFAVFGAWWVITQFARMGVTTTGEGLIIRNWFRREFIAWPEIEAFKFGTEIDDLTAREMLSSPYLQTYVVTTHGRHYVMCGITATRLNRAKSRGKVQEILNRLDDERLTHNRAA